MSHLTIRDARQEDTKAMEDLTVAAWQTAYDGIIDPAYVATRKTNNYAGKFQAMLEGGKYKMLVAELNGQVVGYAAGEPLSSGCYDCETKGLYVLSGASGSGSREKAAANHDGLFPTSRLPADDRMDIPGSEE